MLYDKPLKVVYIAEQSINVCAMIGGGVVVDSLERLYDHAVQPRTVGDIDVYSVVMCNGAAGFGAVIVSHLIGSFHLVEQIIAAKPLQKSISNPKCGCKLR